MRFFGECSRPEAGLRAVAALFILPLASLQLSAAVTVEQAQALAVSRLREKGIPTTECTPKRDVDREQSFAQLFPSSTTPTPYIFRATSDCEGLRGTSTSVQGDKTTTTTTYFHIVSVHGPFVAYVAVTQAENVYVIGGAIDSRRQYESLARECQIRLSSAAQASRYHEFYLVLNENYSEWHYPKSAEQAKEIVDRKFRSHEGKLETTPEFLEWWKTHEHGIESLHNEIQGELKGDAYRLSYYEIGELAKHRWMRGPKIYRVSVKLSAAGVMGKIKRRTVHTAGAPVIR